MVVRVYTGVGREVNGSFRDRECRRHRECRLTQENGPADLRSDSKAVLDGPVLS